MSNMQEKINKFYKKKDKTSNKQPICVLTRDIPTEEGYYWWTNFGEHTPCILQVRRDGDGFYAANWEYSFKIQKVNRKKFIEECKKFEMEQNKDGYYYGEELWCRIPDLYLPDEKTKIEPNSY